MITGHICKAAFALASMSFVGPCSSLQIFVLGCSSDVSMCCKEELFTVFVWNNVE